MATKNKRSYVCDVCDEYIEDCDCEDRDYEGDFAAAWYDDQQDKELDDAG